MTRRSLLAWLRRARPPRRRLLEALGTSLLAAAASLLLLGGSGLLIGRAAGGGGLAALGALLIVIELVAFLRAPLRYEERLLTHRVALGSMVRWRAWLYDVIAQRLPGGLSRAASGELLDRAVEDVDALEDLWVRVALPLLSALSTGLLGALLVAFVLPIAAFVLLAATLLGMAVALLVTRGASEDALEEARRRGAAAARTVDLVLGLAELTMAGSLERAIAGIEDQERGRAAMASRAGAL